MKKTLIYSLVAVLILCAGIAVGMNFNKQKNTPDSTPEKEVAPEEIEYSDNEVVSDESKETIEYMTSEDKAWLFQQVYDGIHGMMEGSGASDDEYLFAELRDLPSLAETASRKYFDNRKAPDNLEDEYKAWRSEKYGKQEIKTSINTSKAESTNKTAEKQQNPVQNQTQNQQKPTQNQNQSQKPTQSTSNKSNAGEVETTNPFADQDRTITPEEEQQAIENTREATEKTKGQFTWS